MTDLFGRKISYLRVSVTDLCDLRCRYCMPAEGVFKRRHDEMMTEDELVDAVEAAASLGISKIRVTGGEPLVKSNIISICRRLSSVPGITELCLTTNGTRLAGLAQQLRGAGVSRVNISLDTLDADKYAYITRVGKLSDALAGLHSAMAAGFDKVKINAVLIGGFNDNEIPAMCALTYDYDIDVRFIELMPMCAGGFAPDAFIPCTEVLRHVPELKALESEKNGVAQMYKLPGAIGRVGLITPVSTHFCAECNRIRLTPDGKIKPCLHSSTEYPIRGLDKAGMAEQMRRAILSKPPKHGTLSGHHMSESGRNMNEIGG